MMAWPPGDPAVAAMLKRRGRGDLIARPRRRNATPEADAQAEVVRMLERTLAAGNVFWSATMNGVKVTHKVRAGLRRQGVRPGVFDLLFIPLKKPFETSIAKIGQSHWIEMKATTSLTPEQKLLFDVLFPLGLAQVCRTVGEVEDQLRDWGMIP